MTAQYNELIAQASQHLAALLLQNLSPDDRAPVLEVDREAATVLRQIGHHTVELVYAELSRRVTEEAEAQGLTVQRRPLVTFAVLFGCVQVESPYLWSRGAAARPVKEQLGITHGGRTPAVERALTDFGSEESFAQAATRFAEHYGWEIGRSSVRRVVEAVAEEAEAYVEQRLEESRAAYDSPLAVRPGVTQLLAELDGCEIRTGQLVNETAVSRRTEKLRRRRQVEWREVRVGLTGRIGSTQRTYVARMGSYAEVCGDLFSAAVGEGLSSRTKVIAVADGGQGLREEMATQFPQMQFILDQPHLVSHLYETAEAAGHSGAEREQWVSAKLSLLSAGRVREVVDELQAENAAGTIARMTRLRGYLERFSDAVSYDEYKARGYPLGSGEVESAHRSIPQKRLKIPGASWHPTTINPMLALRVIRANQWWAEFWQDRGKARLAA